MKGGIEVETKNKKNNRSPGIQKVLANTSYKSAKSIIDKDKVVFRDILQRVN